MISYFERGVVLLRNLSLRFVLQVCAALAIALAVTIGVHWFLYERVFYPLIGPSSGFLEAVLCMLWMMMFFGFALLRALPLHLRKYYEAVMFFWMGLGLFFFMSAVALSLVAFLLSFVVSETHLAAASLCLGFFLSVVSYISANREKVTEAAIALLKPEHKVTEKEQCHSRGFRAVALSDIHVSGLIGKKRLSRIADRVLELQPDIVFIVGDLVDGSVSQLAEDVRALKALCAPHGVYFVTGNHEYFSGAAPWKRYLAEELNWNVLENEAANLEINGFRVRLLGIEDRQSLFQKNGERRTDERLALASSSNVPEPNHPALCVLLAHQPKDALQLADHLHVDIQISGHTHAGQIWPFSLVVRHDQKFLKGLYEFATGQRLYVSQGTCYWGLPFRLGTSCEISLLAFKPALELDAKASIG